MSKVCFTADQHIKLGQKNVPRDWQRSRFMLLAAELNKYGCDYHVFGGDLLDVSNPSLEEVGLMYDFLQAIDKPVVMISGNHELSTKTLDCYRFIDNMLTDLGVRVIRDFTHHDGIDYIPYNILHKASWGSPQSSIAVTHVRGEIPPHVTPEIDLTRFEAYDTVFAGDLHSYTNSQGILRYPGSPFSTSFHRSVPTGANGVFLIDTDTGNYSWDELYLPQLVRKRVKSSEEMVQTPFHHTIYELEGSLDELSAVSNSELLDKKITVDISTPATLQLEGDLSEELAVFLKDIKNMSESEVAEFVTLFKEIVRDTD